MTEAVWHGYSSAVICDAAGRGLPSLLRRCVAAVDADLAVAMVNPGEERPYLAAGFVPTPRQIRFIGKRLTDDAPELPKGREAWRFIARRPGLLLMRRLIFATQQLDPADPCWRRPWRR